MTAAARTIPGLAGSRGDGAGAVHVTLRIGSQLCGIPVGAVRDVLGRQAITRIPLAPPEVAGSLNLRGRIVTAIDLRRRLGLAPAGADGARMCVVVDLAGELYGLLADEVGEVIAVPRDGIEDPPATLDPLWRQVTRGIHRMEDRLLVVLDIARLLDIPAPVAP